MRHSLALLLFIACQPTPQPAPLDAGVDAGVSPLPVDAGQGADAGCAAVAYGNAPAPAVDGGCGVLGLPRTEPAQRQEDVTDGPRTWDVRRNWTYAVRDGQYLQGDLWLPRFVTGTPGLVVLIHGGGWEDCGRRRQVAPIESFLKEISAVSGAAVWNVEYRLRQEGGGYPANLTDVKCALQWIVARLQNRPELNVNPERLVVMGESAGAHLAAMVALTQDRADLEPRCTDGARPPPRPNVQASYAFSPVADLPALAHEPGLAQAVADHYTNGACTASSVDPGRCSACGVSNRCDDASPLQHACNLPASTQLVLVQAPRTDAGYEYDWLIPYRQSARLYDAVQAARPGNVHLWVPAAAELEARRCPSTEYLLAPDGGNTGGFAHGWQPCLYQPLLPFIAVTVGPTAGPRDGG